MQDDGIDDLLALAARDRPAPSPELIGRVLADAARLQPQTMPVRPAVTPPRGGLLARLAAAFGGAPVLAGVCSSVLLGMAVGYLNPTSLDYLAGGLTGAEAGTLELFPSVDALLTEG